MNRITSYILLLLFVFSSACETESTEVTCYPQRVKTTLSSGAGAISITADYKYTGELVDRIIWSNSQTHYFSYDEENQLSKVEEINVKTLVKTEYRVTYDSYQLMRIEKYRSGLDYLTQQPIDTSYVGYQVFSHEGANVSEEEVFVRPDETVDFSLKYRKKYSYDQAGNITELVSMNLWSGDTAESYTFTYDLQKNPFDALKLYFNGESFVNNVLQKEDKVNDNTYNYQIIYNANLYPEQINVKEDGYLYQVITYDYTCE